MVLGFFFSSVVESKKTKQFSSSTTSPYNLLLRKIACNIETFISLSLYFVSKMFCNSISKFARLKIVIENIWRTYFFLINTTNFLFYNLPIYTVFI